MIVAFKPRGSRALRVIVAEMAVKAGRGSLLTFAELAEAIGVADDEPGHARVRQAVAAARPVLLVDHRIALVADRGKGYRTAWPDEFAGIAQDHRRKSDKQIGKALAVIEHAPVDDMSPDELKRFQATAIVIRNLHGRMTSAEQRIADLEAAVERLTGPSRKVIPGEVESA